MKGVGFGSMKRDLQGYKLITLSLDLNLGDGSYLDRHFLNLQVSSLYSVQLLRSKAVIF